MPDSSLPQPAGRESPGSSQSGRVREDATLVPAGGGVPGSSVRRRATAHPLPRSGDRIDSFVLEESIGVGGMGAVYRALDLRLDRHVALKLLPTEQSADADAIQRFYQEARAAARLDHENIARVHSIGHDGPYHWIAFEYIEGVNIRQRVAEFGPLAVEEAVNYTLQIAGALIHAAERGVVHRDIKPSNIIVTPHGRAKLVDMGLARRFERGGALDDGLTQSGMTLGTFDYISPEQARDPRNVDVRSDLYSLGCTLFHMLTGRPPFPEGTVLQKLLQHQNEPPPEVRESNPEVPAELSSILQRLMAKDRERRYQAPEQLARDLMGLADDLGLRSISPEGLVWLAPEPPLAWERHLFWALPVVALGAIVGVLAWWSESPTTPTVTPQPALASGVAPSSSEPDPAPTPSPVAPVLSTTETATVPSPPPSPPIAREMAVATGGELASLLQSAPSGTTLILSEEGPYELVPTPIVARPATTGPAEGRELTVRAAPGVRPILKAAAGGGESSADRALLSFQGGRVVLEGLTFQLDPGRADGASCAVHAHGVDLAVRRSLFRVNGGRDSAATRLAALRLDGGGASARPAPRFIEECHFDGGQIALWAQGPLDALVRDCTFGPSAVTFWLDNAESARPVSARLTLRHASILGGEGTVFRISGAEAVVRLDDSVVAPLRSAVGTLVAIDDPDRLDWIGRGNLFARIDTYLQPAAGASGWEPIRRFDAWAEDDRHVRELGSGSTLTRVWLRPDPAAEMARSNPTPAFALEPGVASVPNVGVRRGPVGVLPLGPGLLASVTRQAEAIRNRTESARAETPTPANPPAAPEPEDAPPEIMPEPMTVPEETPAPPTEPTRIEPQPPTATLPTSINPAREPFSGAVVPPAAREDRPNRVDSSSAGEVRDERELRQRLRAPEAPTEAIRLAPGALIETSALEITGPGRWVIRGATAPDGSRSRIRYRPGPADTDSTGTWSGLFRLTTASLELQDLDIELAPGAESAWAGIALGGGSDVNLVRCAVTSRGDAPRSVLVAVQGDAPRAEANQPAGVASIRATDCLLRSDAGIVDVASGVRIDLTIDNSVIGARGPVVRAQGSPRGAAPESLKIVLRQVAALMSGGLVRLESAPDRPELPLAEVVGRDSIFAATPGGAPLFRVDGQEDVERLRDRILWEGHAVAYHNIETYRRDQTSQPGSVPVRFDRPDWEVAVGPREDGAVHGDLKFLRSWPDSRPLSTMTPEDMLLDRGSPARASGPNPERIPVPADAAPATREHDEMR